MRGRKVSVSWVMPAIGLMVSCASQGPVDLGVSPVPLDLRPAEFFHDSVMVRDDGGLSSRAILAVAFEPGVEQSVREGAIRSVSGRVVGGVRIFTDGYYYVWVPHDETLRAVDAAIAKLRGTPGVDSAVRLSRDRVIGVGVS